MKIDRSDPIRQHVARSYKDTPVPFYLPVINRESGARSEQLIPLSSSWDVCAGTFGDCFQTRMYVSTLGGYTRTYIHRVPLCFLFFFSSFLSFSRFSFISFLRLILVSAGVRTRTRSDIRRRLIPRDTRDFFAFPPAKVDFPFRVPGDVDAANKSPSSTFKRRLSSYALSHPFSSWKYLIFPLRILSLSLSLSRFWISRSSTVSSLCEPRISLRSTFVFRFRWKNVSSSCEKVCEASRKVNERSRLLPVFPISLLKILRFFSSSRNHRSPRSFSTISVIAGMSRGINGNRETRVRSLRIVPDQKKGKRKKKYQTGNVDDFPNVFPTPRRFQDLDKYPRFHGLPSVDHRPRFLVPQFPIKYTYFLRSAAGFLSGASWDTPATSGDMFPIERRFPRDTYTRFQQRFPSLFPFSPATLSLLFSRFSFFILSPRSNLPCRSSKEKHRSSTDKPQAAEDRFNSLFG